MRKLFLIVVAFLPLLTFGQAHLGLSESEIKNKYPEKSFETDYTDEGQKYISTFMIYGTFVYYFDKETGLSSSCIQVVDELPYLNGQVEAYNKKYVIISDTKWKAYLEGGGIINIELVYKEEYKLYVFYYTD
jgi:hypothetical protein